MENISVFVKTLKRMYTENKISETKIKNLYTRKVITLMECDWILDKSGGE